jgi:hypothetical protein
MTTGLSRLRTSNAAQSMPLRTTKRRASHHV